MENLPAVFMIMWGIFSHNMDIIDNPDVDCLARNIYFEARGESTRGRTAVAFVTMNRVKDSKNPVSVCQVVKQAKTNQVGIPIKKQCQFSWYCDGKPDVIKDGDTFEDIFRLASFVYALHNILPDPTNGSIFYHSRRIHWPFSKDFQKTITIENHVFYKKKDK